MKMKELEAGYEYSKMVHENDVYPDLLVDMVKNSEYIDEKIKKNNLVHLNARNLGDLDRLGRHVNTHTIFDPRDAEDGYKKYQLKTADDVRDYLRRKQAL